MRLHRPPVLCITTPTDVLIPSAAEVHGAKLRIAIKPDDVRHYDMSPCLKSKKDAKEAVCRLAARSGLKAELEAQRRLLQASTLAINRLGPRQAGFSSPIPPKAGTVQPEDADYLEKWVPETVIGIGFERRKLTLKTVEILQRCGVPECLDASLYRTTRRPCF